MDQDPLVHQQTPEDRNIASFNLLNQIFITVKMKTKLQLWHATQTSYIFTYDT